MARQILKTKIGFIPVNWDAWNGDNWAEGMRDRCVEVLKQIPGLELVVPSKELTNIGCVSTVDEGKKVAEYFIQEKVKGILIGNMTFGMEVAVGTFLNYTSKDIPILHFATRSGPINDTGNRLTDTWCGQFMTASSIKRRGFKFVHINTSNPEDQYFKDKIEIFTRAVCAISRFVGLKIGMLGTRPQLFESQQFSEQAMQHQFRQMVVPMDLDSVLTRLENVDVKHPEVQRIMHEMTQGIDIAENVPGDIEKIAKAEYGYLQIAKDLDVDALAVNCWTRVQERIGVSICSVSGRLNDQGLVTACEVDILGSVTMHAINCAGLNMTAPHFIDWADLHPTQDNVWLAWHCGNGPQSICAKDCKPKLQKNERLMQWCPTCFGALEFRYMTGAVSCARLVEYDAEFSMFIGSGEVVNIGPYIRGTYGWVKVNDVMDWENKMIDTGIIHHGGLIHDAKVADALEWFCYFLNIKSSRGK